MVQLKYKIGNSSKRLTLLSQKKSVFEIEKFFLIPSRP